MGKSKKHWAVPSQTLLVYAYQDPKSHQYMKETLYRKNGKYAVRWQVSVTPNGKIIQERNISIKKQADTKRWVISRYGQMGWENLIKILTLMKRKGQIKQLDSRSLSTRGNTETETIQLANGPVTCLNYQETIHYSDNGHPLSKNDDQVTATVYCQAKEGAKPTRTDYQRLKRELIHTYDLFIQSYYNDYDRLKGEFMA